MNRYSDFQNDYRVKKRYDQLRVTIKNNFLNCLIFLMIGLNSTSNILKPNALVIAFMHFSKRFSVKMQEHKSMQSPQRQINHCLRFV